MVYFSCLSSFCLPCRCHSSLALVQKHSKSHVKRLPSATCLIVKIHVCLIEYRHWVPAY